MYTEQPAYLSQFVDGRVHGTSSHENLSRGLQRIRKVPCTSASIFPLRPPSAFSASTPQAANNCKGHDTSLISAIWKVFIIRHDLVSRLWMQKFLNRLVYLHQQILCGFEEASLRDLLMWWRLMPQTSQLAHHTKHRPKWLANIWKGPCSYGRHFAILRGPIE